MRNSYERLIGTESNTRPVSSMLGLRVGEEGRGGTWNKNKERLCTATRVVAKTAAISIGSAYLTDTNACDVVRGKTDATE